MTKRAIVSTCVLLAAAGTWTHGQGGTVRFQPPATRLLRLAEPWRPEGRNSETKIIGTVIDIRQVPVAHAKVQLRDLTNGKVQQESVSGELGEYEFHVAEPGTYVVEMVLPNGQLVALSNAGALVRYQTMNTVIQLPGRWDQFRNEVIAQPRMTNFVGMSAQSTMTATTIAAAVNTNVTPADPGEPVSP